MHWFMVSLQRSPLDFEITVIVDLCEDVCVHDHLRRRKRTQCSSEKFNPKRRNQQFLFFKSFYVTELEKRKKFPKYPMRENKDTNSLVCDAMLKMAKN